jgi:hypothetical protein
MATVTLSDTASPPITDWQGISNNFEKVMFFVRPGYNRLNAAIAFQNASLTDLNARVLITLVDPNVTFAPTVSGIALNQPFTVNTDQNAVPVGAFRIPNSSRVRLRAGHAYRFAVRSATRVSRPELHFLDARLPATTTLTLASEVKGSPPVKKGRSRSSSIPRAATWRAIPTSRRRPASAPRHR